MVGQVPQVPGAMLVLLEGQELLDLEALMEDLGLQDQGATQDHKVTSHKYVVYSNRQKHSFQ